MPQSIDLESFLEGVNGVSRLSFSDDGQRSLALLAAYALVSRLESPWETILRCCMSQVSTTYHLRCNRLAAETCATSSKTALNASLKVARDIGLFEALHQGLPRNAAQLADTIRVPCDPNLLERNLRHLAATHVLEELSPGVYRKTAFSDSLLEPNFGAWIDYTYDALIPCFYKMPEYLAKNRYTTPTDPAAGVFQYTKGWKGDLFAYYDAHPEEGKTFNHMMGGVMQHQASWLDIYPHQISVDNASPDGVLLVDVGGNVGHDVSKFCQAHPELASRVVLQDRTDVVANAICPPAVRKMAHDFFNEQPVKGARLYYMHGVIHDWSDKPALEILKQIRSAMKPGYSKLLVHDHVVQDEGAHPHATAYDLTMMVKVAGQERTEAMWRTLLGAAGFRVLKIWTSPLAAQSIVEAEPADC